MVEGVVRCPICNSKTIIREAKKGPFAGRRFHLCMRYPECKGKVPIDSIPDNEGQPAAIRSKTGKFGRTKIKGAPLKKLPIIIAVLVGLAIGETWPYIWGAVASDPFSGDFMDNWGLVVVFGIGFLVYFIVGLVAGVIAKERGAKHGDRAVLIVFVIVTITNMIILWIEGYTFSFGILGVFIAIAIAKGLGMLGGWIGEHIGKALSPRRAG